MSGGFFEKLIFQGVSTENVIFEIKNLKVLCLENLTLNLKVTYRGIFLEEFVIFTFFVVEISCFLSINPLNRENAKKWKISKKHLQLNI